MPIFFLIVAGILIMAAINNKLPKLKELISDSFQPTNKDPGFAIWILALFAVGAIGYSKTLRPISNAFLILVFVGMFISNKGFVPKFTDAIKKV